MIRKFVYVAVGKEYVKEATLSLESLKKYNDYPACLITDQQPKLNIWDEVIVLENPDKTVKDKLEMVRCEADQIMFLDSDTLICDDLTDAFELLSRFDIVAKQDGSGRPYKLNGVPESFPELNTGVMAFNKNKKVVEFFMQWEIFFVKYKGEMGPEMDQRAFREAVFRSDIKIFILPPEYNQMNITVGALTTRVKVMHGRPNKDIKTLSLAINKKENIQRVFIPKIGIFLSRNEIYISQFFIYSLYFIRLGITEFFKRLKNKFI